MKTLSVEMIRHMFPEGCNVVCDHMSDPYRPVPAGTKGTVSYVDDIGNIHVKWENGSSLSLIYGEDKFHKI